MTSAVEGLALVGRAEQHGRTRLALVEDGTVEACWLTIDPLRLHDGDGGLVDVLGIGNVNTATSHRRRGLATHLLEMAIERMRTSGASASLLYGIDDFYDRLGWRSCGDDRWIDVDLGRLDHDRPAAARPMQAADLPRLQALYARTAAAVPGADDRSSGRAWSQLRPADVDVVERDGAIVGWAWVGAGAVPERDALQARSDAGTVALAELQAVDDDAMLEVVAAAAARAQRDPPGAVRIVTGAPEAHALRRLARAGVIECRLVDEVRPRGGAMLLPFDDAGATLLHCALYQFLPDRF